MKPSTFSNFIFVQYQTYQQKRNPEKLLMKVIPQDSHYQKDKDKKDLNTLQQRRDIDATSRSRTADMASTQQIQ